MDRGGNVYVVVSSGSCPDCTAYNLVPAMANAPTSKSQSRFVGSSPTGFTGVLDAPDSFFQQLGMVPCSLNSEGVCIPLKGNGNRRSRSKYASQGNRSEFDDNHYGGLSGQLLAGPAQYHQRNVAQRRALSTGVLGTEKRDLLASVDDSGLVGIQTPLLCLKAGEGVTWSITALNGITHYPEYTADSLYNTNPNFDYGAFQNLKKDIQAGRTVASFNQIFSSPGVYAFRDVGEPSKQTIVGVVNPLVNCPQSFSRSPIQPLSADLLKDFPSGENVQAIITPDYALITGIGVAILLTLILGTLVLYFTSITGWGRSAIRSRRYREVQKVEHDDLHTMATKKYVVKTGSQTNFEQQNESNTFDIGDNRAVVDLEGFNIQTLFDKLQDQTNLVSEQLSKQKDDVKEFYEKVERTLTTRSGAYSSTLGSELLEKAKKREERVLSEVARRRFLGSQYVKIVTRERDAEKEAGIFVTENMVAELMGFESELSILMEDITNMNIDDAAKQLLHFRKIFSVVKWETRIFPNSVVGKGALLEDQSQYEQDSFLQIKTPCAGAKIVLNGDGDSFNVPKNCCIHPETKNIVPIEGNIWFDTRMNRFEFGSNIDVESIFDSIPFVCNSMNSRIDCYPCSLAPYAHMIPEDNGWPLNESRDMLDPYFGFRVPVLGVTVDLRTGKLRAVGGTMVDPETGLTKAIRIGDFYQDPESLKPLVVMGVAINPSTLKVVPVGKR